MHCLKCNEMIAGDLWHPHLFVCQIAYPFDYDFHFILPAFPFSWRLVVKNIQTDQDMRIFFENGTYNVFIGSGYHEVRTQKLLVAFGHAYQCALSV